MANVFLCMDDYAMIHEIVECSASKNEIELVGIVTSVPESIEELKILQTEILVLQNSMDYEKTTYLLELIQEDESLKNMKILNIFKDLDVDSVHTLLRFDIQSYLIGDYTIDEFMHAIDIEIEAQKVKDVANESLDSLTSHILINMGVPVHLSGFHYIKTAAILLQESIVGKSRSMKSIYIQTAKRHFTTASRVEKAIRNAISYAYRIDPNKISIHDMKPTNSQFVRIISEKLKLSKYSLRGG